MKLTDDANRAKCSFSLRSIDDEQTLNRVEKKIGLRRQEEVIRSSFVKLYECFTLSKCCRIISL